MPVFQYKALQGNGSVTEGELEAGGRQEAFRQFKWTAVKALLDAQGVELISAGLDEAPDAYKDIRKVMADQADLVEALAEFQPKLVKMDDGGKPRRRSSGGGGKGKKGKKRR